MVEDRACLCLASMAELLQGVKDKKEKRQLEMLFDRVPLLHGEPTGRLSAGQPRQMLRSKGLQIR